MLPSQAIHTPARGLPAAAEGPDPCEETALLASIAAHRDRAAFRQFYERYERTAYNLAYHLTGDRDRAAEAVQSSMMRVWMRAENFQPGGNPRAWFLRIVARESMRTGRRRRVEACRIHADLDECPARGNSTAGEGLVRREEQDALQRSLERLPKRLRRIVSLYYGAGMSQREIGEELGLSQKTISTHLDDALQRLRALLAKAGVAAAAPLLRPAALAEAALAGFDAPASARIAARTAQSGRAASRKAAAGSTPPALWIAGAAVLLAAAAAWPTAESSPPPAERTPAPAPATETAAVAAHAPGLLARWTFEHGPPKGFEVIRGAWAWQAPTKTKRGCMRVEQTAWVVPPVTLPEDTPVRMAMRFFPVDVNADLRMTFFPSAKNTIPARTLWRRYGIVLPPVREQLVEEFLWGRYTAGRFEGQPLYNILAYDLPAPGAKEPASLHGPFALGLVNLEVFEIEVRALAPGELPAETLDLESAIRAMGASPQRLPAEPFRLGK